MDLHRIPRKQLDVDIFYVDDDMDRIVGLDLTTGQVHDHIHDSGDLQAYHKGSNVGFDPTTNPLTTNTVQHALAEFANKPIAAPVHEISAASVVSNRYQITSIYDAYVGVPAEDPNAVFAIYDIEGRELPITILDITDDEFGTTSVVGNTWHSNPWIQLSGVPNQQILIKFGIRSSMGDLPINAFLKEGVIVAEVDSEVTAAIADIKGTAWNVSVEPGNSMYDLVTLFGLVNTNITDIAQNAADIAALSGDFTATIADIKGTAWDVSVDVSNSMYDLIQIYSNFQQVFAAIADVKRDAWNAVVPNDRDLVGLDGRMINVESVAHQHNEEAIPALQLNGVSTSFSTTSNMQSGSIRAFLNGNKLPSANITQTAPNVFSISVHPEQIPDSSVGDTLEVMYIQA